MNSSVKTNLQPQYFGGYAEHNDNHKIVIYVHWVAKMCMIRVKRQNLIISLKTICFFCLSFPFWFYVVQNRSSGVTQKQSDRNDNFEFVELKDVVMLYGGNVSFIEWIWTITLSIKSIVRIEWNNVIVNHKIRPADKKRLLTKWYEKSHSTQVLLTKSGAFGHKWYFNSQKSAL